MAEPDMVLQDDVTGKQYADYSPSSTEWYQKLPQQRYVAYVTVWIGVAELLMEGRQQEIDEEALVLLAWAPHDTAARDVAEEMIDSGRYPGLERVHRKVYGSGFGEEEDGYGDLDFPKITRNDIDEYNVNMITALGDNGYNVPRMQTGPFHSPGLFEKVASWLVDTANLAVPEDFEMKGDPESAMLLGKNRVNPTQGDVFYTASQYGAAPGDSSMDMRIAAGNIGQFAAEGYMAAQVLGVAMGGARSLAGKVPQHGLYGGTRIASEAAVTKPLTQSIVEGINAFKGTAVARNARDIARGIRWTGAAAGALSLGAVLQNAYFGNLDMTDLTNNMDPETQQIIQQANRRYSPIPYRDTGRNFDDSAVGKMGDNLQERLAGNSTADAWQAMQSERRGR